MENYDSTRTKRNEEKHKSAIITNLLNWLYLLRYKQEAIWLSSYRSLKLLFKDFLSSTPGRYLVQILSLFWALLYIRITSFLDIKKFNLI